MKKALRQHWPEYLMEAAGLGLFMVSACMFGILLWYPASPAAQAVPDGVLRRLLMGLAMGATAVGIIYSPMGKRSGAHINPSVTLAFLSLGKIAVWDAVYYIVAQFAGGAAGVLLAAALWRAQLADPAVGYVITVPGVWGAGAAFAGEFLISFLLMMVVLVTSNTKRLNRWTGTFAGVLLAVYITLETPFSGMSMNPARTLGSAVFAKVWTAWWVYSTAPPLAMLAAAALYRWRCGAHAVLCAKLHHENRTRCIFRCGYCAAADNSE